MRLGGVLALSMIACNLIGCSKALFPQDEARDAVRPVRPLARRVRPDVHRGRVRASASEPAGASVAEALRRAQFAHCPQPAHSACPSVQINRRCRADPLPARYRDHRFALSKGFCADRPDTCCRLEHTTHSESGMATTSRNQTASSSLGGAVRKLSRPQIVWASLLLAMTVMTGLLSLMTGAPNGLTLTPAASAVSGEPGDWLEGVLAPVENIEGPKWDGIVIHHSASIQGSLDSITRQHELQGLAASATTLSSATATAPRTASCSSATAGRSSCPALMSPVRSRSSTTRRRSGSALWATATAARSRPTRSPRSCRSSAACRTSTASADGAVELHRDVASTSSPGRFFPQTSFEQGLLHASR